MSPVNLMTSTSTWMQVTGWTLAHFVWQGAVIAIIVAATLRLSRRWPSEARYVVACGGLVAMVIVPIATALVLSSRSPSPLTTAAPTAMAAPGLTTGPVTDATDAAVLPAVPAQLASASTGAPPSDVSRGATNGGMPSDRVSGWLPLVVWSWCAGVVFLLGRMAVRLRGVRRLRRTAVAAVPAPLRTACHELALRLGLRVAFRVAASAAVDSPTVIGWWRPVILLPIAALANLSPGQVEAILAHELAHIRRHDYLVNLLQSVVETLLFYHPAVWWLSGRVRTEREDACDDIAVTVCGDRAEYAAALATLETRRGSDYAPALAAAHGSLVTRIRRILHVPIEDSVRSPGWVTTLLLGVMFTTGVVGAVGMVDLPASLGRSRAVTDVTAVEPAFRSVPPTQPSDATGAAATAMAAAEAASNARGTEPEQAPPPQEQAATNFEWRIHEIDHFDIYYYPELEEHLERIASYAERAYAQISADLSRDLPERVSLVVFRTHSEFEQSNIVPGGNAYRVGSFSEPFRQRIVLPIDEPPDQLYRRLVHELTHQFAFEIIPRSSGLSRRVPLWVDEGLADYMPGVWRPLDLMTVRDAALADIVPRMSELVDDGGFASARVVYNLGHAAFEFIEARWGKVGVRQFLLSLRTTPPDGGDVYEGAFGLSADDFDDAFQSYLRDRFQAFQGKERPNDYGRDLVPNPAETPYAAVVSVEPSPSGELIAAFAQNRTTRELDIVLLSAADGEVVRNLTPGRDQDLGFESIEIPGARWNTVPWMSWSSVDDRLAYFVRTGPYRSLALHNVETGDMEEIVDLNTVDQPESPDISPDGRFIAFSAQRDLISDIYLLDLETRDLTNLTDDKVADYAPTFSPDGSFLVYLARVSGNNTLFTLDLDTKEKTRLTFGNFSDTAAQFVDDHTLVFSSTAPDPLAPVGPDAAPGGDIFNIFTLDLDSRELRQLTDTATGNLSTIVLRGDDESRIAFVTYFKGEYGIHTIARD